MRLLFSTILLCLPLAAEDAEPADPRPTKLWGTVVNRKDWQPLTGSQRWSIYWRQSVGTPGAYFRALGSAAGDQADNDPPQWGQGADAYSRRVANRFARLTIQESIEAAGAAALQHDTRYVRCPCRGFLPRLGYSMGFGFVTLDKNGRYVPAAARIGAAFGAEFIGNSWMPEGSRSTTEAMRGVGFQIAFGSVFNVIREFSPELKRTFTRTR